MASTHGSTHDRPTQDRPWQVQTDSSSEATPRPRQRTGQLAREWDEGEGLRKKAMSLGEGLHRLGTDLPDGELPPEQDSFLHSKYASSMSSYSLAVGDPVQSDQEGTVLGRRGGRQKKRDRISKGLLEFIQLGEPLVASNNKFFRSLADIALTGGLSPKEEEEQGVAQGKAGRMEKEGRLSRESSLSSDPQGAQHIQAIRLRRKTVSPDREQEARVSPRRRQTRSRSRQEERRREDRLGDRERRKTVAVASSTSPKTVALAPSTSTSTPPKAVVVEVPPLPQGKTLLDLAVTLPVDQVFTMLFSESEFYKNWLFDPKKGVKIQNLSSSEFEPSERGEKVRSLTYERIQSFGFSSATIKVSQKMRLLSWSQPSQQYGVDIETCNSGALYADSFMLLEHYRLVSSSPTSCQFSIVASVTFLKSTMLRGRIETEVWAGQQKSVSLLEEHLAASSTPPPSSSSATPGAPVGETRSPSVQKPPPVLARSPRPARVKLYPDNYQYSGQLILVLILLILSLLVVSLFKMSWTLEKIDLRLASIEQAFTALSIAELASDSDN